MEEKITSRVSRRRLIKRLGIGTAVAWFTPIMTSLGSVANAGCCDCVDGGTCDCTWTCGGELVQCSEGCGPLGAAYCSLDVDRDCFCWEDSFCSELSDCTQNSDCPPLYACIPNTCCGDSPKCLPPCGVGPRSRRRHGRLSSGRVR